jgi:hypothetical protein
MYDIIQLNGKSQEDLVAIARNLQIKKADSMSREDLTEMANDTKDTEVCCHFCNKAYTFTPDELKKLLAES